MKEGEADVASPFSVIQKDQAAWAVAACSGADWMAILRGFMASGSSRTRSMCRSPFLSSAPVARIWSANWKWRVKDRPAMPRCRKTVFSSSWRALPETVSAQMSYRYAGSRQVVS